ncbi:hypothetical protein [Microbulbifer sp. THAF38]|uniref:hypothetical protein n=1 Tax=Microbulbifer sp. THAF38 TaxID=2587856 RepID=UPI0012688831|nr:hypothetical protein [Microbulbifer sp. THAF38]QFT56902.1 hypothetical protein FIU95_20355 [Microbulbifer sp. THAF38]
MYPKFLSNFLIIGCLLLLSACSSDDKDKNNELPEKTVSLTIKGYVETTSFTNAEVRLQVADTEFYGEVDTLGNYSIDIEIPESQIDSFVRAEAIFPAESSIRFVSLLGSVRTLLEKSGEDGVLVQEEKNEVNITSISTAFSAHLKSINAGEIKTDSELTLSLKSLDSSVVFDMAAFISLYSSNESLMEGSGLSIPNTYRDIYELAANKSAVSISIYNAKESLADLFDKAQSSLIESIKLFGYLSNSDLQIADTYYLPYLKMRLTLRPDGTGEINGEVDNTSFTWSKNDNGITFKDADLIRHVSFFGPYSEESHIVIKDLVWMIDSDAILSVILQVEEYDVSSEPINSDLDIKSNIYAETAIRSSSIIKVPDSVKLEQEYSMPIPVMPGEVINPVDGISPRLSVRVLDMSFSGEFETGGMVNISIPGVEGDGRKTSTNMSGVWRLEDDKKIIIDTSAGSKFTYVFLDYMYKGKNLTFVLEESEKGRLIDFDTVLAKDLDSWKENTVEGIYQFSSYFAQPLDYAWFEVNSDGTVKRITIFDWDSDGELVSDELDVYSGLWKLSDDGNLIIRFYRRMNGDSCMPSDWDPLSNTDCSLVSEREWNLSQVSKEEQLFWIRKELKFFSNEKRDEIPGLSDLTNNIFGGGHIYNSFMYKVSERPIVLPSVQKN